MDVSVVIVNWNAGPMIVSCVQRILDELRHVRGECIVVDNASQNGDVSLLRLEFPNLKIIANPTNVGFAKAVNQGISQSRGKYLLFINPDAFIAPGAIGSIVAFMNSRPEVGIVGPRILNPDGSIQGSARAFPRFTTALFGRTSLASRVFPSNPMTRRQLLCRDPKADRPSAVDWVSGACMFVRREVFGDVGVFDERYFLFWEDADICWRAHERGWSVIYNPGVHVTHLIGGCSRRAPIRSLLAFHVSAFRLYRRHVTQSSLHPLNLVSAAGLAVHFAGALAWHGLRSLVRPFGSSDDEFNRDQLGKKDAPAETKIF